MTVDSLAARLDRLSPAKRALLELRLQQKTAAGGGEQTISRRTSGESAPLSFAQQRLWFLNQLAPESPAYNEPKTVRLTGCLNIAALQEALQRLVTRHEALRTTFTVIKGVPAQVVAENRSIELPVVDLSVRPDTVREAEFKSLLVDTVRRPFDLSRDLMLRALLIRLADQEHVLVLVMHHIASDRWSSGILWRELATIYEGVAEGRPFTLPELPIQYADFALWQRQHLQGEVFDKQLSYWKKQLTGISSLRLPADRRRATIQNNRGARQSLMLPAELAQALKALSRENGVTLFMMLLAAFQTLLHRYTGQEDIVVGSPIAGRTRPEVEGLIGFFINTLVLRADLSGNPTFRGMLAKVREVALEAYSNQDLPFEKLVEELQPERNLADTPLFQVTFALQNVPQQSVELLGVVTTPIEVDNGAAKFELSLFVSESDDDLIARIDYNMSLFDPATVTRMLSHFKTLLHGIVANPDQRIADLPILTEAEKRRLLVEWNGTKVDYPKDKCVYELFEAQVEKSPAAVAVVFENEQLTYQELNRRANQLAHYLQKQGVGPEVLVGICMERSLEMIIGLLGILKAGGAYVPLDPEYPKERLVFMLEDTRAPVLVTQQRLAAGLIEDRRSKIEDSDSRSSILDPQVKVIYLDRDWKEINQESDENLYSGATANNLAYVIYTSGSTGKPKGVEIPHRGITRLLFGVDYVELDASQTFLHLAPTSFDASTFEIWGALLHGAKCVLYPGAVPSAKELGDLLHSHKVSTLWLTASLFDVVIDEAPEALSGVRQLLIGGEALSVRHVQRALARLPNTTIINGYGPTESTTFSCCYPIPRQADQFDRSIPLGRPIGNTQAYILDEHLNPVPIGIPGEIYIGGDGLARGYLNWPELTAEKFIPHPFAFETGARLYKTGDHARYLSDGSVEFMGRADDQVKIRGFRIEPGEVESLLVRHSGIREAVVVAREYGLENSSAESILSPSAWLRTGPSTALRTGRRLVAYVVPKQDAVPTVEELRSFLKEKLPQYMVPSAFVFLDFLPLTPNGKIDRNALPAPDQTGPEIKQGFAAVLTPIEEIMAVIWENVLDVDYVGIDDNFFDLGGHSLLAVRLFSQIREGLGVDLPLHVLFEAPTMGQFAARVEAYQEEKIHEGQRKGGCSSLVELQFGQSQTPVFCFSYMGGFDGELLRFVRLARSVGSEYSFYGLRARGTDGVSKPHSSVEKMVADYIREIQALQSHGPYYLIGECLSGRVAYEAAQQLRARGEQVGLLAFLDYTAPRLSLAQYVQRSLFQLKKFRRLRHYVQRSLFRLRELRGLGVNNQLRHYSDEADEALEAALQVRRRETSSHPQRLSVGGVDMAQQRSNHVEHARNVYKLRVSHYRPRPYDGLVTLLLNQKWYDSALTQRLSASAAQNVEVHRIPGDHNIYINKSIDTVAEILRSCLKKTEQKVEPRG